MVSSDRLSAFDVVLPTAIPGKGIVLTQLSRFWFGQTTGLIGNHLTSRRVSDLGWSAELTDALEARSMIVAHGGAGSRLVRHSRLFGRIRMERIPRNRSDRRSLVAGRFDNWLAAPATDLHTRPQA